MKGKDVAALAMGIGKLALGSQLTGIPLLGGSTRLKKDSMKYQALLGREDNLRNKKAFASGDCDARENS